MTSMYKRFFVIYIVVGILTIFSIVVVNILVSNYFIKPNEISKADVIAQTTANDIVAAVQLGLLSEAQNQIEKILASNSNILQITFINNEQNSSLVAKKPAPCTGFLAYANVQDSINLSKLGTIEVCYSKYYYEKIVEVLLYITVLVIIAVLSVTIVMLTLLKRFLNPLEELALKLKQFDPQKPRGITRVLAKSLEISIIQNIVISVIDSLVQNKSYLEQIVSTRTKELEDQKKLFQVLSDSSINPILLFDESLRYFNTAFIELSGYEENEIRLLSLFDIFIFENSEVGSGLFLKTNAPFCARLNDVYLNCKNGMQVPITLSLSATPLNDKMIYIINITDLTELKQKDLILLTQSRFAAMGEMIANIAHQWRQPLNVMQASITQLSIYSQIGTLNEDELQSYVNEIKSQITYLSNTIDDFRNFYKDDTSIEFNSLEALQKASSLVSASFSNNFISLEIIDDCNGMSIQGSLNKFIQAVISMLNNAKDAICEANVENKLTLITHKMENNNLLITINDSGGGVPMSVIGKIFDPYFTTKSKAQGTGIGLYMSKQIIEQSLNGQIEVSNQKFTYKAKEYFGAEFKIVLPIIFQAK